MRKRINRSLVAMGMALPLLLVGATTASAADGEECAEGSYPDYGFFSVLGDIIDNFEVGFFDFITGTRCD